MLSFASIGIVLGLSAGFSPGPLTALLISETLLHNVRAGLKVALAPIICDAPIILATFFIITKLSNTNMILAVISFLGAAYVVYLGIESFKVQPIEITDQPQQEKSLQKGIIVNFLNPHPYIFWTTVGAPTVVKAMGSSFLAAAAFILCFYLFIVGSKMFIAILVSKSGHFIKGKIYILINRIMGILLFVFAVILFYDGIKFLK
jgi:threonine/homoserine/homoserine lactone efflux protein